MKIFKYQKNIFYQIGIIFIFLNVINNSFAESISIQHILRTNLNNRFIEVKEDWVCNDSKKIHVQ